MLRKLFHSPLKRADISSQLAAPGGDGVISGTDEFRLAITRHCARAERSGRVFSLILFDVAGLPRDDNDRVVECALRRARATDHVGWLAAGKKLGVLLCGCESSPARDFVAHVQEDCAEQHESFSYTIHTCPGDTLPDEIADFLPKDTRHAEPGTGGVA